MGVGIIATSVAEDVPILHPDITRTRPCHLSPITHHPSPCSQRRWPLAGTGDLDVPALPRGGLDGVHHLEDVVGQLAAGPVCCKRRRGVAAAMSARPSPRLFFV